VTTCPDCQRLADRLLVLRAAVASLAERLAANAAATDGGQRDAYLEAAEAAARIARENA
jgi:hypothetical protein